MTRSKRSRQTPKTLIKLTHTWTIENFTSHPSDRAILSPPFSAKSDISAKWRLVLRPGGYDTDEASNGCVSIFLFLLSCRGAGVEARYQLSIHNGEQEFIAETLNDQPYLFERRKPGRGSRNLIRRDVLLAEHRLPGGTLVVHSEVWYAVKPVDPPKPTRPSDPFEAWWYRPPEEPRKNSGKQVQKAGPIEEWTHPPQYVLYYPNCHAYPPVFDIEDFNENAITFFRWWRDFEFHIHDRRDLNVKEKFTFLCSVLRADTTWSNGDAASEEAAYFGILDRLFLRYGDISALPFAMNLWVKEDMRDNLSTPLRIVENKPLVDELERIKIEKLTGRSLRGSNRRLRDLDMDRIYELPVSLALYDDAEVPESVE